MLRAVNGDPLSDYINGNFIDVSVLIRGIGLTGEGLEDVYTYKGIGVVGRGATGRCERDVQ